MLWVQQMKGRNLSTMTGLVETEASPPPLPEKSGQALAERSQSQLQKICDSK